MIYAAIVLFVLGFAVGLTFRLRTLLLFVGLVLIASIVFSIGLGFQFFGTFMMVMAAQTILQASYFLGLVVGTIFSTGRMRPVI